LTILDEILEHKRSEVSEARQRIDGREMSERARSVAEPTRGFRARLAEAESPVVIAEVKRRSPSKGEIRPDFDPVACAKEYAANGATALSILTDEHYFGGHLDYLGRIRASVALPLLRKDFIVDSYQIDEARAFGADAVLLIASALSGEDLRSLREHAESLGLDALVEVHAEDELEVALASGANLIGVNNRDLRTFDTDLAVTERLAEGLADGDRARVLLVAESGIGDRNDIRRLERAGARAFLVGESLMRQPDLGAALRTLRIGDAGAASD
jgi:indole-3-glycerol phosphate synthase